MPKAVADGVADFLPLMPCTLPGSTFSSVKSSRKVGQVRVAQTAQPGADIGTYLGHKCIQVSIATVESNSFNKLHHSDLF